MDFRKLDPKIDIKDPFTLIFNRKLNTSDSMTFITNESRVQGPLQLFWKLKDEDADQNKV